MSEHHAAKRTDRAGTPRLAGYLVEFETASSLRVACEKVRDAGFTRWDAHTPFPVHGLDGAMGLKPTALPWLVFAGGATGALTGLGLQWWANAENFPLIISGKPFWSIPANIPVTFELTVLFASLTAFLGMLVLNGFPRLHHPVFTSTRFRRASIDRFFLSVDAADPHFEEQSTLALLRGLGGSHLERLEV
jgi:hypothetical protein